MNKQDLIKTLVNDYGYEREDIKIFTNAKLAGLIKQEKLDAEEMENDEVRISAPKKSLNDNDKVVVMNGLTGILFYHSERTNKSWTFQEFGEKDSIEYSELIVMKNKHPKYFTDGLLIVLDKEVQEEFKLTEMYKNILTPENVDEVFNMDVEDLEKFIDALPDGMKTSFVNIAMKKYEDKEIDKFSVISFIQEKFNFDFEDNAPRENLVSTRKKTNGVIYID